MFQNIIHAFLEINTKKIKSLQKNFDKLKIFAKIFFNVFRKRNIKKYKIDIVFFVETLKYKKKIVFFYLRFSNMMSC